jgi:hypothetical protein
MWSDLPARNLLGLQRQAAVKATGRQVRALLAEGYDVDADQLLDELHQRIQSWKQEDGPRPE